MTDRMPAATHLQFLVLAVLKDGELATRLGRAAKRRVTELFSRERMVRETQDLYMQLLEKNTSAPLARTVQPTNS